MSAKTERLAQRKEELRLHARIERMELTEYARELRRLRKPANFALIGGRIFKAWRSRTWISGAAALLAARGMDGGRVLRALRYAGYAYAAWQTYRLFRQYVGDRPRGRSVDQGG